MTNKVFIATSLDGYIAGKNNELDWLDVVPAPENMDMGYQVHIDRIDALVMGRNTMELIAAMDIDWPYDKPVFVLSRTLKALPKKLSGKAFLVNDDIKSIEQAINKQGYENLYIDGGLTIQSFLNEDLIDEMVITTIPILLGGGLSLFGALASSLEFRCIEAKTFTNGVSQTHFKRCR